MEKPPDTDNFLRAVIYHYAGLPARTDRAARQQLFPPGGNENIYTDNLNRAAFDKKPEVPYQPPFDIGRW